MIYLLTSALIYQLTTGLREDYYFKLYINLIIKHVI